MRAFLKNCGINDVRTAFRSPWQNGICERVIGTLRRESLDHIISIDERYLYRLLSEYIDKYYHPVRTHSSLDYEPPDFDQSAARQQLSSHDELESEPTFSGLYTN